MGFLSSSNDDIFDNLPDAVLGISYDRKILFSNKEAENLFGYSKRELKNKDISTIFEDGMELIYDSMINARKNNITINTKSQKNLVVEIMAYDSEIKQEIIISSRDVTETHNIIKNVIDEYKINQAKMKKRNALIADMSEDLKNPMNSIIGFSQALLEGLGGDLTEKQQKYLNLINKNATGLCSTLDSIVDITMLDAGKIIPEKKSFDVTNVVNLVVQGLKSSAKEKDIELTAEFSKLEKLKIYADESLLRRCLSSLVENAIKFTDTGHVKVKVSHPELDFVRLQGILLKPKETEKSYMMFSISDTGNGIAEEELNTIFDEYSVIERKKGQGNDKVGTQLTLPIVRKIIEELGGVIWVESQPDRGSIFNFIIPVEKTNLKDIIQNEQS